MHQMSSHPVHEVPVVRNKQQGTRILSEPVLQPQTGIQIQVVGGLVQQQQIGWTHQCLGQVQSNTPATGKCRNRALGIAVGEAQAPEQSLGPTRCGPGFVNIQLPVQAGNGMVVTTRFRFGQRPLHSPQLGVAIQHKIPGGPGRSRDFLSHMGNPAATGQPHAALLGSKLPQQKLEKTGFAGTVSTNNGNALPRLHGQVHVF